MNKTLKEMIWRAFRYHLDNYRGTVKRLDRGDAIESLA